MNCKTCGQPLPAGAPACGNCGTPPPAVSDARGFEYKSEATLFGLPLLHISLKYRRARAPVPAKGIIAIGQFAFGVLTISQFGVGLFSISQFTIAGWAVAQFAIAYNLIAQFGIYLHQGHGEFVYKLVKFSGS